MLTAFQRRLTAGSLRLSAVNILRRLVLVEYSVHTIFQLNNIWIYLMCSTAYKNISAAVELAHSLGVKAKETAIRSETELYPKEGESIIEKSFKSLKKSQKIHQNSLKEMEKLEGTFQYE